MSFFGVVLSAEEGQRQPKFVWSTVNLLVIERDRGSRVARRVRVGSTIFEAWLLKWSTPQEVISCPPLVSASSKLKV